MKKNQIFIKCGTEYKEMTKELLEACDLAGEIEKKFVKYGLKALSENFEAGLQQNSEKVITEAKFETKSSLIDSSKAEVDCFFILQILWKNRIQNLVCTICGSASSQTWSPHGSLLGRHHSPGGSRRNRRISSGKRFFQSGDHGRFLGRR